MHLNHIKEQNARLTSSGKLEAGQVCVFAGATSGIGAATVESMARMLPSPTMYIIGRSESKFAGQRAKLETVNKGAKVWFLEGQISLLRDVDAACKKILEKEEKVDFLYMSPGLIPLNGAEYTKEGLETCFAISYYCRLRLTSNLLPLLRQAPHASIVSVLNGGKEELMKEDDIGLGRHWSPLQVVGHATTMTSLAFEYLAQNHRSLTLLHVYPGWVRTDNFTNLTAPQNSGIAWKLFLSFVRTLATSLAWGFGISAEESGERQGFHLTAENYGPGAWRINHMSDLVPKSAVLEHYKDKKWTEKVWEHTVEVWDKGLARNSDSVPR